ncbi:MAG TPA: glycoside hydrolase family 44 protein [Abditibacteriaceae bacterium]
MFLVSSRRRRVSTAAISGAAIRSVCCATSALLFAAGPAYSQNAAATFNIDASQGRRAINPNIYGVAYATSAELAALNSPLNRWGGNATTRYNWEQNASNRAHDWFFESIGEEGAAPGEAADAFIAATKAGGASSVMTIPTIGWVAKLGPNRGKLASFSVAKYGPQQYTDGWMPDAGNGVRPDGSLITGNDPNDAHVPSSPAFQQNWLNHLKTKWGTAAAGGVRYYAMDNEPSIWHASHRDVHPNGATMEEVRDAMINYGSRVKTTDPQAVVLGPEEWGWSGFLLSGYDQKWSADNNTWWNQPDKTAHGGKDYIPWLLEQMKANETATGKRLLDVLTVHYYPQGGEFSNDISTAMQQRRNRSTRSLWDPNYTDESWISDKVQLIPRLKGWVNSYYPGTQTGITEYNWGAEGHISGAIAQADVLGIFGREGLDMANFWGGMDAGTPIFKAMQMYRNYDGAKSTFGDTSVRALSTYNPDNLSAFAALRSKDGALTVMAVNKYLSGTTPLTLNLAGFTSSGVAQVWQLASSNNITRLADLPVSSNTLTATLPAQSVTLFVIGAPTTAADTTAPTVAFTTPANASGVRTLPAIAGTATDNTGGTGVAKVEAYLRRKNSGSVYEYWGLRNGSWGWTTTPAILATKLASPNAINTNWSIAPNSPTGTVMPSGTNLPETTYTLFAYVSDRAGNRRRSADSSFKVDTTLPVAVAITTPANGSVIAALPSIAGTAADNSTGSGITKVEVFLRRKNSSNVFEYWAQRNGNWGWNTTTNPMVAKLSAPGAIATNWNLAANSPAGTVLPSGDLLPQTTYYAVAYAYDKAGNKIRTTSDTAFRVDSSAPASVAVTTPSNGSTIGTLTSLGGNATDNTGGSGIARVETYLRRRNSSGALEYWAQRGGTWSWSTTTTPILSKLATPGALSTTWSIAANSPAGTILPSGTNLPAGIYYCLAYAFDQAGNRTRSSESNFRVGSVSGRTSPEATSPVVLSSSQADSEASTVTLVFSGALNATTATDSSRYVLSIDGAAIAIDDAVCDSSGKITLLLPEGALRSGAIIALHYDLLDAAGRRLQGSTRTAAR